NDTRRRIKTLAHSVWLKADLETLLKRVTRRGGRPLLKNKDPRAVLAALMAERDPVYANADITVETSENPPAEVAERMIKLLESHLGVGPLAPAGKLGPSHGRAMGARGRSRGGAGSRQAKPQPSNRG
ncbi:MAG: hypothetical protein O6924_11910, partial [Alphaproteobacteria bacterium]|nr:hypothetical protein [Alphaproteobacteria bacterium]